MNPVFINSHNKVNKHLFIINVFSVLGLGGTGLTFCAQTWCLAGESTAEIYSEITWDSVFS